MAAKLRMMSGVNAGGRALADESGLASWVDALRNIPDLEGASCKGMAPLFDYIIEGESPYESEVRRKRCVAICRRCPVLRECRAAEKASRLAPVPGIIGAQVVREKRFPEESNRPKATGPTEKCAACGREFGSMRSLRRHQQRPDAARVCQEAYVNDDRARPPA